MPKDAQQGSPSPSGATEPDTAGARQGAANGNGGSRVALKTALVAAAVGTAVAAAASTRGSSAQSDPGSAAEGARAPESRAARARETVRRGEPALSAAWDAAKGSIEPVARNGARQAGRFLADRSPDFVRENVIPPFVEGLTEARAE